MTIDPEKLANGLGDEPFAVTHELSDHPLQKLEAIAELADYLPLTSVEHNLGDVDPSQVAQLDSVEHIKDLIRVGQAVAEGVKIEHFHLDRFGQFY